MAEAFVKIIERDYARINNRPDAASVLQLDFWFQHHNTMFPSKALGYRSPSEFRKQMAGEDDRDRGRRCASTARRRKVHGGDRVKPTARAARRRDASGLTRAQPWTTHNK
jgi:hypothetical protein